MNRLSLPRMRSRLLNGLPAPGSFRLRGGSRWLCFDRLINGVQDILQAEGVPGPKMFRNI